MRSTIYINYRPLVMIIIIDHNIYIILFCCLTCRGFILRTSSWMISGVSYLSREQENEMLRCLDSECEEQMTLMWHNTKEIRETPLVGVADVLFSERMKSRFNKWRNWLLQDRNKGSQFLETSNNTKQQFQTIFFKMRPALTLNGFTAHHLRLIQSVMFHFGFIFYYLICGLPESCSRSTWAKFSYDCSCFECKFKKC